jgi:CheY-like chemotaxis protein
LIDLRRLRADDALTKSVSADPKLRCGPDLSSGRPTLTPEVCVILETESRPAPKMLIADDDPCVLRAVADRCAGMGFEVETATNGLQALIKASQSRPDILVIDVHMPELDGLSVCAYLSEIAKRSPHVLVVTGRPGPEIEQRCKGVDAICIQKGQHFWREFDASLAGMFPRQAAAIERSKKPSAEIEVKKYPRILLVDDDLQIKKFFFRRFEKLGAELLYAADGTRGFWMARHRQPSVIVADYLMPNGDAEYLLTRLRNTPQTSSIPVIVHTGRNLDELAKQRLRRPIGGQPGAARILQKSPDTSELSEALLRLCGFASDPGGQRLYQ